MNKKGNNASSVSIVLVAKLPLGLSMFLTAIMLGSLIWFSGYGFDFSDESFYLVWMSNPFNYPFSVTQFGFIYHPIYKLLGGDVAALRQANILTIFCLAWVVGDLFLKRLMPQGSECSYVRLAISSAIATSSLVALVFAGLWLPTPSYNSLAFKGLLVITIGLLLANKTASRMSNFGWVLIGIGGWVVFMAKPTTAAAAGLVAAVYLLISGQLTARILLALFSFLLFLLLSALVIDGSVIDFVERFRNGMEMLVILGGGHSIDNLLRLDSFALQNTTKGVFWIAALTAIAGLLVSLVPLPGSRLFVSATQVLILIVGVANVFRLFSEGVSLDPYQNLMLGAILFAAIPIGIGTLTHSGFLLSALQVLIIVVGFAYYFCVSEEGVTLELLKSLLLVSALFLIVAIGFAVFGLKSTGAVLLAHQAWILVFIGLIYAYALGTNNNYWIPISCMALYFALLALTFLSHLAGREEFPRLVLTLAIVVQVISASLLTAGLAHPYQQPNPLYKNDYPIDLGQQGGRLILAQSFGEYISSAKGIAALAEFSPGTPMIDMSGHSPGILHLLGATSVGLPWTLGGYPGSARFVEEALKLVPCEQLAEAWILTEPTGRRAISPSVLSSFGASLIDQFQVVGELVAPDGQPQQVRKPTRSIEYAKTECEVKRALVD